MGFRNPITTAEGVDTGKDSTGPGVRMYQDPNPEGVSRGVVEFRNGIAGDRHATITRTVNGFVDGDLIRSFGGTFTIDAGSAEGIDAGGIEWDVIPAGDGTHERRARLLNTTRGIEPVVPITDLPLNTALFGPYGAGYGQPRYYKSAAGHVFLDGLLAVLSISFTAGAVIGTLPPGCRPGLRLVFGIPSWNNRFSRVDVHTGGAITWEGFMSGDASSSVGAYFSLAGLQFRAEN